MRDSLLTLRFLSRSISDMISPSSDLGMLPSWICLTATVSPVIQFSPR